MCRCQNFVLLSNRIELEVLEVLLKFLEKLYTFVIYCIPHYSSQMVFDSHETQA